MGHQSSWARRETPALAGIRTCDLAQRGAVQPTELPAELERGQVEKKAERDRYEKRAKESYFLFVFGFNEICELIASFSISKFLN